MKFSEVKNWKIPEGNVQYVRKKHSDVLWGNPPHIHRYVSLGDSIAAGWGVDDRANDSYFGLLRNEIQTIYGSHYVSAVNHAEGGDQVNHLMRKLDNATIRNDIANAELVTICIGANDALTPAMQNLEEYITAGDSALVTINNKVQENLSKLADDTDPNSYMALLNKLFEINPNANYVFMTVYSPYKYYWIEDGKNGFFKPLLDTIPQMKILWGAVDVGEYIKDYILDMPAIRTLVDRVNGINAWSEKFVTQINELLREKVNQFKSKNPNANLFITEAKALFDSIPDRTGAGEVHYNDLVHVEYTRGYDMGDIHWGLLWEGSSANAYWTNKVNKYLVNDSFNLEGLAMEFVEEAAVKVIKPNCDPHPDRDGFYLLMRSFADTLRENVPELSTLPALNTVTFNANGGTGSMAVQKVAAQSRGKSVYSILNANSFTHPTEGYYFAGWKDGGNSYSNGQAIYVPADKTLYAEWSNIYTILFRHSKSSDYHGSGDTGPMECYALWIDGTEQSDLGAFTNGGRTYRLPYGSQVGVIAQTKEGDARSYITLNGNKIAGNSADARYGFTVTSNMDIHFEWNYWLNPLPQSYWNCYVTTY